ncbi:hypothetical protein FRB90_008027 [Tulasnella sp. 427]|nr:hypothetical protein FRB90_008027 [Tulasnella sp. 427]
MAKILKKTTKTAPSKSPTRSNAAKLPTEAKVHHAGKKNNLLGTRSNGGRSAPPRSSKNTRNVERREELNAEANMSAVYANFIAKSSGNDVLLRDDVVARPTSELTAKAVDEAADALAAFGTA